MKIAFLCTFLCEKDTNNFIFYWLMCLFLPCFFPNLIYIPGRAFGQNIYRWELQYRLHRNLYFFERTRTHFCQQLEITFFETIIWDKKIIYLFKSWSNILCKILCIHCIKIEGLVLEKTCRYKEITCGVPQGSVLGPISYLVQKWKFQKSLGWIFRNYWEHHLVQISGQYMTFCKRNIFANHRIVWLLNTRASWQMIL